MKKVFLEDLPHCKTGNQILWKNCTGSKVRFIYDDIDGFIEIIDFNPKTNRLTIRYNSNTFCTWPAILRDNKLGKILGRVTKEYKIEIGTNFKDDKRDITIIDKKKVGRHKHYRYHCNKCGFDCKKYYSIKDKEYRQKYWIDESSLLLGNGCNCCAPNPQIVVLGINDIPTVAPWMVKYFPGGYGEAKKFTKVSGQAINPLCPDCGKVKRSKMIISKIHNRKSIGCSCSDGFSYPAKVIFNLLNQLNSDFETEYSPDWAGNKRYDYYIASSNTIIEAHGPQHTEDKFNIKGSRTLAEEIENDRFKKELAINNGITERGYIVICCEKSDLELIKQNILNSELANLFDLSHINWLDIEKKSLKNLVKVVCDHYNDNFTISQISEITHLHRTTVWKYVKKGVNVGWCDYNPQAEKRKSIALVHKLKRKPTQIFKNGLSLGIFNSVRELAKKSEELFGVELTESKISEVCRGNSKHHKGFTFMYLEGN